MRGPGDGVLLFKSLADLSPCCCALPAAAPCLVLVEIMFRTLWIPAAVAQCMQGVPQVSAILRQLCLVARRRVHGIKTCANVLEVLQDVDAASGKIQSRPAANGQGFSLTLTKLLLAGEKVVVKLPRL